MHSTTPQYLATTTATTMLYTWQYITLHFTTLRSYSTVFCIHYNHHEFNCNCATLITLHHNNNSTTLQQKLQLQLQLQLRCTTLHPDIAGELTDQVTIVTIANAAKKNAISITSSPPVGLLCHPWFTATTLSYTFPL